MFEKKREGKVVSVFYFWSFCFSECGYLNLVAGGGFRCLTVMYEVELRGWIGGGGCYHDSLLLSFECAETSR